MKRFSMQIGAVADDFTGATDLATTLSRRGMSAAVVIEDREITPARLAGLDAVVVALKSRTAPVDRAVSDSLDALERVIGWGAERVYLKYCSTFDSTDSGNIGPVLDAFLERLEVDRTVVVPAFPANGRTVERGSLYVNGELLENSPMRHHPLTPMTRSRLRDILAPQTGRTITEIPLATVRAGVDALRAALSAAPAGYLVVDATQDDDLRTIAAASASLRLLSGGAGLAIGLDAPGASAVGTFPAFSGRRLVVCGSASAATRAQIADASTRQPTRKVDVARAVADPASEVEAIAAWFHALPDDSSPVVYSVGEPADVLPGEQGVLAAAAVEAVLSAVVARLVEHDAAVDQVIVAGGETSGAVVKALGIALLEIGPELAPGVCWSAAETAGEHDVALVLKSGNFGAVDLFTSAWQVIA
jgi:uncharacterized protein YgbK (DUF1537 family)